MLPSHPVLGGWTSRFYLRNAYKQITDCLSKTVCLCVAVAWRWVGLAVHCATFGIERFWLRSRRSGRQKIRHRLFFSFSFFSSLSFRCHQMVVAFSSLAMILGECLIIYSPPALFFFFFKVEISSRTLIPFFLPGSVHSGSASWDDCGLWPIVPWQVAG